MKLNEFEKIVLIEVFDIILRKLDTKFQPIAATHFQLQRQNSEQLVVISTSRIWSGTQIIVVLGHSKLV